MRFKELHYLLCFKKNKSKKLFFMSCYSELLYQQLRPWRPLGTRKIVSFQSILNPLFTNNIFYADRCCQLCFQLIAKMIFFFCRFLLGGWQYPPTKLTFQGPMRRYPVQENLIDLAVSEILRYTQTNRHTSCYFIIRIVLSLNCQSGLTDTFYR